jgi:hypothetical protein
MGSSQSLMKIVSSPNLLARKDTTGYLFIPVFSLKESEQDCDDKQRNTNEAHTQFLGQRWW